MNTLTLSLLPQSSDCAPYCHGTCSAIEEKDESVTCTKKKGKLRTNIDEGINYYFNV